MYKRQGKIKLHYRNDASDEYAIESFERYDDNQWHHVIAVKDYDTGNIYLYIDAQLEGQLDVNMGSTDSQQGLYLGSGHNNRFMEVILDEVAVLDKAVSPNEVLEIYQLGSSNDLGNLTSANNHINGYWKFDEGAGDLLVDHSGNGNDGTKYGATWSEDVPLEPQPTFNHSLSFDGVDDYIDFASRRIDLSNGFTLESWFKTPGGTSDMILFSSRNPIDNELEVEVYLSANAEEISVNYFEQVISTVEEVNDNLWHHWAITVDTVENQIAVYIDGSLDKGSASLLEIDEDATRDITVVSEFRFANGLTNEDANLLGYIDEVRPVSYTHLTLPTKA